MIIFKSGNRRPDWNASTTPDDKYILAEVLSVVVKEIRRGRSIGLIKWKYQDKKQLNFFGKH